MLIDFGEKASISGAHISCQFSQPLGFITGVSSAGSVPAPNPRDHRTPQVTDYERNASHYQFRGPARQVGKSVKKSDDCRSF
jgi:hypothetical protein